LPYQDFRQFLDVLRQHGELIDVNRPVALNDVGKADEAELRAAGPCRLTGVRHVGPQRRRGRGDAMVAEPKVRVAWSARGNPAQMRLLKCQVFEIFFGGIDPGRCNGLVARALSRTAPQAPSCRARVRRHQAGETGVRVGSVLVRVGAAPGSRPGATACSAPLICQPISRLHVGPIGPVAADDGLRLRRLTHRNPRPRHAGIAPFVNLVRDEGVAGSNPATPTKT
jgi:hypothetical protein